MIRGIGPVMTQALLNHFGSVAVLKKADIEEIAEVPNIGSRRAHIIYEQLNKIS